MFLFLFELTIPKHINTNRKSLRDLHNLDFQVDAIDEQRRRERERDREREFEEYEEGEEREMRVYGEEEGEEEEGEYEEEDEEEEEEEEGEGFWWCDWLSDLELQSILSLRGVNPAGFVVVVVVVGSGWW